MNILHEQVRNVFVLPTGGARTTLLRLMRKRSTQTFVLSTPTYFCLKHVTLETHFITGYFSIFKVHNRYRVSTRPYTSFYDIHNMKMSTGNTGMAPSVALHATWFIAQLERLSNLSVPANSFCQMSSAPKRIINSSGELKNQCQYLFRRLKHLRFLSVAQEATKTILIRTVGQQRRGDGIVNLKKKIGCSVPALMTDIC